MDFWYVWVLPLAGGVAWYFITKIIVLTPGALLNKKFVALGELKGKSLVEIVEKCGQPNSVAAIGGKMLRQWQTTGYHIALLFDENDVCLGISSVTSV